MFMTIAQERLKLKNTENEYLLDMYRNITSFYIEHKDVQMTEEQYYDACEIMSDMLELQLSVAHTKTILQLYPHSRIRFAVQKENDSLSFALSHFFLGCAWPTYGEKVDINKFTELLQEQAKLIFPELAK